MIYLCVIMAMGDQTLGCKVPKDNVHSTSKYYVCEDIQFVSEEYNIMLNWPQLTVLALLRVSATRVARVEDITEKIIFEHYVSLEFQRKSSIP
jgi:hypothetical protein